MRFAFPAHNPAGLHYAARIFVGAAALWPLLRLAGDANPIWAVISLIVVIEPQMLPAWRAFLSRIFNTLVGCVVGVLFLLAAGAGDWVLPAAVAVTVLVCTYLVRLPLSWRIAPVTAALVIASGEAESDAVGRPGDGASPHGGSPSGQCDGPAGDMARLPGLAPSGIPAERRRKASR